MFNGVDTVHNLLHVLCLRHTAQHFFIHEVEIAVEVDEQLFVLKSFTVVGLLGSIAHHGASAGCLQGLELFATPQVEFQVHFVAGHFQSRRVGQHDLGFFKSLVGFINNHLIEHACFGIFLLYEQVDIWHAIIEHAFGNFDSGRLLLHTEEQGFEVYLCLGRSFILKIKGNTTNNYRHHGQWGHDAAQRNTRCLHCQKFKTFA